MSSYPRRSYYPFLPRYAHCFEFGAPPAPVDKDGRVVVQAFWHGPKLNLFHWACMRSFLRNGLAFYLYTYEPFEVPEGVVLREASDILPLTELFYFNNADSHELDLGPFSDLFRFKLLLMRGGWYVDVDTVSLSADLPRTGRAWSRETPESGPRAINGSQMAFPKGDPLVAEMFRRCRKKSRNYQVREDLGPNLITNLINELKLPLDMGGEPDTFYPIRWIEMFKLAHPAYTEEVYARTKRAVFLPVYQSFFQYCGLDLAKMPPRGSYLHDLYQSLVPELAGSSDETSAGEVIERTHDYILAKAKWAVPEIVATVNADVLRHLGIDSERDGAAAQASQS